MANVLINPSFEVDTSPWLTQVCTLNRIATDSWVGSACGEVVCDGGANAFVLSAIATYAASEGQVWSSGMYIKHVSGTNRTVRSDMRFWDAPATTEVGGQNGSNFTPTTGAWTQAKNEGAVAPAGTAWVRYRIAIIGPPAAGDTFRLDGMQLEQAATLPPYNPAGSVWTLSRELTFGT